MASFDLVHPATLSDALDLLRGKGPATRPFAGGTALMLMMKAQFLEPERLVNLGRIGGPLTAMELIDDNRQLRIGAMVTFSTLEHASLIAEHLPVVTHTMKALANVRVRNVATVGGNLAHGDPHLDLPPVWMALGAAVDIDGPAGQRSVGVEDFLRGYYETDLEEGELITAIRVPLAANRRAAHCKVTTRANHDWPALGVSIALECEGREVCDARIVLSAAIDKATRLRAAENELCGRSIDDAVIARVVEAAGAEIAIESDSRGSQAYKTHLLRVHLARELHQFAGI